MRRANLITVYVARKESPFDEGTEVELLEDYRPDGARSGLFLGYRDGKLIEIFCPFTELEVRYEQCQ